MHNALLTPCYAFVPLLHFPVLVQCCSLVGLQPKISRAIFETNNPLANSYYSWKLILFLTIASVNFHYNQHKIDSSLRNDLGGNGAVTYRVYCLFFQIFRIKPSQKHTTKIILPCLSGARAYFLDPLPSFLFFSFPTT